MKRIFLSSLFLLTACDRAERIEPPTAEEAERLNDAEAMLNELAKEEGAAPESTAPSNSD